MSENARQETPGFFIDPRPEHSTPTHTQQSYYSITMRHTEDAGADQCGRQKAELTTENCEQQSAKREFFKHRREDHIFEQTNGCHGRCSPDEIGIKPLHPMARQM